MATNQKTAPAPKPPPAPEPRSPDRLAWISPGIALAGGAVSLAAAAVLDWFSGTEIALSIVYLAPIALVTWKTNRKSGLAAALACGVTWLGVELLTNKTYTSWFTPFWNALVRTTFFTLVSVLMSEVLRRKRVEQDLRHSQELLEQRAARLAASETELQRHSELLQSILNSMADGVIVVDSAQRLVLINPAARRMLQVPAGSDQDPVWPEFLETAFVTSAESTGDNNPFLRAARGDAVNIQEVRLEPNPGADPIWFSVAGRPLLDRDGGVSGGVVVFSDITARKDLERTMSDVSEREQRRIGEDLHDGLCQYLVGAAFAARKLAGKLAELELPENRDATQIAELLGDSIAQARDLARGLYLAELESNGLVSALESLAARVSSRHSIDCRFIDRVSSPVEDESVATNLFRIAQEAIMNAVKHAEAKRILVTLETGPERLWLEIADNGAGLPPGAGLAPGMGTQIMRQRARMMGAELNVGVGADGPGTVVQCFIQKSKANRIQKHSHA